MSGIAGIVNLGGAPVEERDLKAMASLLERRGPDRTAWWRGDMAGLGHTLLATTPELDFEAQPVVDADSGCSITADVRLDNRADLLTTLGLMHLSAVLGDAALILAAYLRWGSACPEYLLGDFAFAIWDSRDRRLFCARDHLGMRPFYYHHSPNRFVAVASEARALLALPLTPHRINEGRIADFLVSQLEGIDKTSTFFEEIHRLPPAHSMTVGPEGTRIQQYWSLEQTDILRLPSDQAYSEAFLDVFSQAVGGRLRSVGPVGSMLSGGMDSNSVVAVARKLLAEEGLGLLHTFSGVGPDPATCVETRTIHSAIRMGGMEPHLVSYADVNDVMPELEELNWHVEEPFDRHMALIRAMYLEANRQGIKVMLDGGAGDVVLAEGTHIARLLKRGRWIRGVDECFRQRNFWGTNVSPWREMVDHARTAFVPEFARRMRQRLFGSRYAVQRLERNIRDSLISEDFANRINLLGRLEMLDAHSGGAMPRSYVEERARAIEHPYLTVGRERYDRTAAALAVEPRDPFMDLRVVKFCLSLPGEQRLANGWPKMLLRRAMDGLLPDEVRWRAGKQHLGGHFTAACKNTLRSKGRFIMEKYPGILAPYIDERRLAGSLDSFPREGDHKANSEAFEAIHLALWLSANR